MITPEQLEERKSFCGASDVASIMNLDPFRPAYATWLDKTGRLEPETTVAEHLDLGNRIEPVVLGWAEETLGQLVTDVPTYRHAELPLGAHPDAVVYETNEAVEAKTSGLIRGWSSEDWGEPGTDQVPKRVRIQAHVQMLCMGYQGVVHVPAWIGGRGLEMFHVPYENEPADFIADYVAKWWQEHVVKDTPPKATGVDMDLLKRIKRKPGVRVMVPSELIANWQTESEKFDKAEADFEAARSAVVLCMTNNQAEIADGGSAGRATYFRQTRSSIDLKNLRVAHPEIAGKFTRRSTFPVLRYQKPDTKG